MSHRSSIESGKYEVRRRLAVQNLKSCPLCGAINAADNKECFVCRWSGKFDQDPEVVQIGLDTLIDRCPELAQAFLLEQRRGWLFSLKAMFRRIFRIRSIDLRV